jgi:hypothetical protein
MLVLYIKSCSHARGGQAKIKGNMPTRSDGIPPLATTYAVPTSNQVIVQYDDEI